MSLPYKSAGSASPGSSLDPVLAAFEDPGFLAGLLSSSPGGVVLVEATRDLPIAYCNDGFQRWAPLGRHPVVGSSISELFDWSDRETIRETYREVIRTGRPQHRRAVPYRLRGAAAVGQPCYWSASHFPIRGPTGRVTHVLSLTVDVTEQAGQRARAAESHQRVLTALAAVARHLGDSEDTAEFLRRLSASIAELVSASKATFWRYDAEAGTVSPQDGSFGFAPADLEALRDATCSRRRPGAIGRAVLEDRVLRADLDMDDPASAALRAQLGALGVRDAVVIPWRTADRRLGALAVYGATRPWGFTEEDVWVLRSAASAAALVREHQVADEALAESREREADGLRQQIEQTIKLEQLKADYLKLASHELRAPLGIIRGYVSMLEDGTFGPVSEELTPLLPVLLGKIDEMSRLINGMLETARLEDGALELRRERLDLRDVVAEGVRTLEPLAGPRHRLVSSVPGDPVPIDGDAARLTMVVANLVHNAIKYSPSGGSVRVVCGLDGGSATVDVSDQGIGIAGQDLDRLFTRFGRIQSTLTRDIPGTGLGLYLARDIARRHGGDLTVVSEPGRGSTFTLRVPLAA